MHGCLRKETWAYGVEKCSDGHNTCATVGFNEISLNDTKYGVVMHSYNKSLMTYELVIKQFGNMDVNYKYRCESGFQYALGEVSLNEVVALPKDQQIEKTFVMRDFNLTALIRIPNVYPRPICTATFKKRNITNMSNTTYVQQSVLYVAVCEVLYETYECKGDLDIFCHVGMGNISVMHSFDECVESTSGNRSIVVIIIPVIILLVAVVVCLCFIRFRYRTRRRRRHFHKRWHLQDQHIATTLYETPLRSIKGQHSLEHDTVCIPDE